jgi:hypothetical protein
MNPQAINALAYLMSQIRPDWDPPGCVAALRKLDADISLHRLALAAIRYATDEQNLTPGNLPNIDNRAWDTSWHLPCKTHPNTRARRTDGECAACYVDRLATREPLALRRNGTPPTDDQRASMRASLNNGGRT